MEKIEKYKEIVRQIQMSIASATPEDPNEGDDIIIQDDKGGHYLIKELLKKI